MIHYKTRMLLIIVFFATTAAYGQNPRVYSKYEKQSKATIVYTDRMHLFNTPEHVFDVKFDFRLKQKQSRKPPKSVDLTLWSYPRELKYQNDEGRDISLVADGNMLKVAKVTSMPFEKRKQIFEQFKGDYSEWVMLSFSPEEAKKLATAKSIKLQMDNQEFDFKEAYVDTIRDFANRIP